MRILVIAGRLSRQIVKDRRTLALLFVAPLFIIYLLYIVLTSGSGTPRLLTIDVPNELNTLLADAAEVTAASDLDTALEQLQARTVDGVLVYADATLTVYVEGTETQTTAAVKQALATAVSADIGQELSQVQEQLVVLQQTLSQLPALSSIPEVSLSVAIPTVQYNYLYGTADMTTFDHIAPLMMGFFIFFFVFILAGVAFLRERVSGTLERLLATPVRRYEIVLGYFLGFGIFVFLQTLLIQTYMISILHIALKGEFVLVLLINLLLAAGSLALGTLLSAFAHNELQLFQFIPLVIVPQILFCGLFSLQAAPGWVGILARVFPLTYAAAALTDVAMRGLGFVTILPDLLILFGYMVLFLILNTLVLKQYRKI